MSMRGMIAGAFGLAAIAMPVLAADTTADRLLNSSKEPGNWLMVHRDYNNSRHSAAQGDQPGQRQGPQARSSSSRSAAARPAARCAARKKSTPLVDDGFMYVTDTWGRVMKFDVRSGTAGGAAVALRSQDHASRAPIAASPCTATRCFIATNDMRMIAINQGFRRGRSGRSNATAPTDPATGTPSPKTQGFTGAPLAIKTAGGKELVLQGESTGGQLGTRSWVGAWDVDTGKLAWRTFTIPAPGEPGSETWKDNHNAWRVGGGGVWQTASYDPGHQPALSTAPATPSRASIRSSGRATISSPPAPSRSTPIPARSCWYFQETPNEHWDFDTPSPKMLYEVTINGETRKVVANFSRNGFFYTLDRANGQFLRADQYQEKVTWTKGIDPKTGKPVDYDPDTRRAALCRHRRACASKPGAGSLPVVERLADLLPADARPKRMIAYVAGAEGCIASAPPTRRRSTRPRTMSACRPAAPSRAASPPMARSGRWTCKHRQDRRQGDVPAADRVRHAEHRRRPLVHRPS